MNYDLTSKYFGLSDECLADKGFKQIKDYAGLGAWYKEKPDKEILVLTDQEKIYRVFVNEK